MIGPVRIKLCIAAVALIKSAGMNFLARQKKLREHLATTRFDALLVSHLPNVRYLCGFTGSSGLLLVEAAGCQFLTDARYDMQAHDEVVGAKVVISRRNIVTEMAGRLGRRKGAGRRAPRKTLGIEADHVTAAERKQLASLLRSSRGLRDTTGLVEDARMVKDKDELDCIRKAVRVGAGLFERALQVIRPKVKEVEVAAEMEYAARMAGAEEMSFPTIIASGARSALPHGRASEEEIKPGGFVVCDWGVILSGYCSDQTRTVWVGPIENDARAAYDAVLEAQQAAVDAVKPGATVGEVDSAARKVLRKAGLGRYFTHSTGHGVGIEIHESPRVAAGLVQELRPGMVITIEPGVYLPGKWGVRIEDMVVVTDRGREVLTPTSKELVVL